MWSERNLGSVRGALSASEINPVSVKMNDKTYFLNPIKGCLYSGMETWKRSVRTLSLSDYKASLAQILEYITKPQEVVKPTGPPLADVEREAWKKMVVSLQQHLTADRREVARLESVVQALEERVLAPHFTEQEVLEQFIPLTAKEVSGHSDYVLEERRKALQKPILVEMPEGKEPSEDDFRVNLQTVNRSSYNLLKQYLDALPAPAVREAGPSKRELPKPAEKPAETRPVVPPSAPPALPSVPQSQYSVVSEGPPAFPERTSVSHTPSVASGVAEPPLPPPGPAPPAFAPKWVGLEPAPQYPHVLATTKMKKPVKTAQSAEDRRLTYY